MFAPTAWYGTPAAWGQLGIQLVIAEMGKPFQLSEYWGDFTFSGYAITGGTVTGIHEWYDQFHNFDISDIALDAVAVEHFLKTGDGVGLQSYIYSGDDLIRGSEKSDALCGLSGDDGLFGHAGDDLLQGGEGDDDLYGGEGVDSALYSGARSSYGITVKKDGEILVSGSSDGADRLEDIERVCFSDISLAFDVDGHAGQAMEFIGVVAPTLMNDTAIRGLIISMVDSGNTMEQLCQLALDQNLLPGSSNAELANSVYRNVLGGDANAEMTGALVGYIESHGQANFVATVAGLHLNVDLVGLQQTGVEYLV